MVTQAIKEIIEKGGTPESNCREYGISRVTLPGFSGRS